MLRDLANSVNKYKGKGYTFDRIIVFVNCVALTLLFSFMSNVKG
jgi:hypothetical protein